MRVGIIGGGMMGLTAAYRLSQKGYQVHVLESGEQIGGLSTWYDYGPFTWDKYYHVILRSDDDLLGLIEELGLSEHLSWMETKTGFLWHGKHVSMSNYSEFLRFPVLNFPQKIRLGLGILYSRYLAKAENLEMIPAQKWLQQVFGKQVYSAIWEPLLESKFGVLKEKVPATIIHSTLNRYASTRKGGDGKEVMGHLRSEGLKILFDSLRARIEESGGTISCSSRVTEIKEGEEITVRCGEQEHRFDRLISTLPTVFLQKMVEIPTSQTAPPLFLGVIRVAVVLKKSLSPYYVTNLIDRGMPFTGIIEVSQLVEEDEMKKKKLVMLPRYDVPDSPWFDKSDEEIQELFLSSLKKIWPDIESNMDHMVVHRERIVQALWVDAPPACQEPAKSKDGRIWSVNAELAGRDTLNNNALVRVANRVCDAW